MTKREQFPNINLASLGVSEGIGTPGILSEGFNSRAWSLGNLVLKITKHARDFDSASDLLATMKLEHSVLEDYLGEYMPATDYHLASTESEQDVHVVTVQPLVAGVGINGFVSNPKNPTEPLEEFLEKSISVYEGERLMPDIANIETFFNVLENKNIIIEEDTAQPVLVDTNFGKIQRSKILGRVWTRAIHTGATSALMALQSRQEEPIFRQADVIASTPTGI